MEVHASLIPEYWDKSILEDIEMGNGLSPTEEGTLNKFAKIPLNEKEIDAIQCPGSLDCRALIFST